MHINQNSTLKCINCNIMKMDVFVWYLSNSSVCVWSFQWNSLNPIFNVVSLLLLFLMLFWQDLLQYLFQLSLKTLCVCKFHKMDVNNTVIIIYRKPWHSIDIYDWIRMHLLFPIEFKCASNGVFFSILSTLHSHHTV